MKQNVVFDFDGVVHSYMSGWQGIDNIPDPPVPGIDKVFKKLKEQGYHIWILSTRTKEYSGEQAVRKWLTKYDLFQYIEGITQTKIPAVVYIDDRGMKFDPKNMDRIVDDINNFKTWQGR